MSRWPASSMNEILLAFLLAALLLGAIVELIRLLGRLASRALARRRAQSALAGDWWSRFEDELQLFTAGSSDLADASDRREQRRARGDGQSA